MKKYSYKGYNIVMSEYIEDGKVQRHYKVCANGYTMPIVCNTLKEAKNYILSLCVA